MLSREFLIKRQKAFTVLAGVVAVVAAVLYLSPIKNHLYGSAFNQWAFFLLPLIPAIAGFNRARETKGIIKFCNMLGGNAMLATSAFSFLVSFYPHWVDPRFYPLAPAAMTALVYIPGLLGAFFTTAERRSLTYVFDGVLAVASLLFVTWNTLVAEVVKRFNGDLLASGIAMSSPMFCMAMVTIVLLAARRGTPIFSRFTMLMFALAEGLDGLMRMSFAYHGMATPMNSLSMFFWMIHVFVLTAVFMNVEIDKSAPERAPSIGYLLLPYAPPVLAAGAAVLTVVRGESLPIGSIILGGIVLVALIGRQFLAVLEHAKMGQRLEGVVHELKVRELELEHLSMHDALTSLPNRRYLNRRVNESETPDDSFVVLLIDLDDFKKVNDELGHDVGDKLLIHVSNVLQNNVRDNDTVARLGGDEFAILLENSSVAAAKVIANRIVEDVCQTITIDGLEMEVGMSVGLATGKGIDNFDAILRQADMAMYARKRAVNKGGLAVFSA